MRLRHTSATLLVGGVLALATAAPAAATTCDAYSGRCTTGPSVIPKVVDRPAETVSTRTTQDAATLPFTGGELVLLTAIGAGALAGGTALVVAGRRRKPDVAV